MLKHAGFSIILIVVALCGVLTSYILSEEFYFQDIPGGDAGRPGIFTKVSASACGEKGSFFSCITVSESKWALLFNTPMAVYGVFYYSVLALLAFVFMFSPTDVHRETAVLFFWTTIAGLLADVFLLYISLFKIRGLCPLCMVTYAVSILCVFTTGVYLFKKKMNPLRIVSCMKHIYLTGGVKYMAGVFSVIVSVLIISFGGAYGADHYLAKTKSDYYLEKKLAAVTDIIETFREEEKVNLDIPEIMILGDPKAPVTITEFSDFLCPYCSKAAMIMDDLVSDNPSKVRVIFHNYPLDKTCNSYMKHEMHKGSCLLAKGAVCASGQGAFDAYQRIVFSSRLRDPSRDTMEKIAVYTGVDVPQFMTCVEDQDTADLIKAQITDAKRFGINSTPSIYINGRRFRGKLVKEVLQAIIDQEYRNQD